MDIARSLTGVTPSHRSSSSYHFQLCLTRQFLDLLQIMLDFPTTNLGDLWTLFFRLACFVSPNQQYQSSEGKM